MWQWYIGRDGGFASDILCLPPISHRCSGLKSHSSGGRSPSYVSQYPIRIVTSQPRSSNPFGSLYPIRVHAFQTLLSVFHPMSHIHYIFRKNSPATSARASCFPVEFMLKYSLLWFPRPGRRNSVRQPTTLNCRAGEIPIPHTGGYFICFLCCFP